MYRAYDLKSNRYVACKMHELRQFWSDEHKISYVKHALRESEIHQSLKHPNIVENYDSCENNNISFCSVLQLCDGPELKEFMKL